MKTIDNLTVSLTKLVNALEKVSDRKDISCKLCLHVPFKDIESLTEAKNALQELLLDMKYDK